MIALDVTSVVVGACFGVAFGLAVGGWLLTRAERTLREDMRRADRLTREGRTFGSHRKG